MVNGVKIEPHIHDIRQQSTCILCFSIGTSLYLMMSEITDLLVALSPLPTSPMTQESQFDESKRKADMHNQEESPSCIPISQQGKKRELNQRNQVKPLGLLPILQGNNDDLQKYVAECNDGKQNLLDNSLQDGIFGQKPQIEYQRLQCLYLIIEVCIGVCVVAEAVHALPLLMRETRHHPEVSKGMPSHVDKVVSNTHQGTHRQPTYNCQQI